MCYTARGAGQSRGHIFGTILYDIWKCKCAITFYCLNIFIYLNSVNGILLSIIHTIDIIIRTLLRSRASEPCSVVIKVRALNAHAPTLTFPGARTRCSRPSIGTVFVCDKGPSIQRTGDFLVVLSRYPSHQYQYGCIILLLAIHKDIRLIAYGKELK